MEAARCAPQIKSSPSIYPRDLQMGISDEGRRNLGERVRPKSVKTSTRRAFFSRDKITIDNEVDMADLAAELSHPIEMIFKYTFSCARVEK